MSLGIVLGLQAMHLGAGVVFVRAAEAASLGGFLESLSMQQRSLLVEAA